MTAVKPFGSVFLKAPGHIKTYWRNVLRGSSLGTLIGALPGAGADIAAWIADRSAPLPSGADKDAANALADKSAN